ncbi:MAG: response regulator [Acetanaerobacterium sp.]
MNEQLIQVMIVDDEPFIRQGLRMLIDWEENGYQIAAEASDGEEAVEKLQCMRVDLMIVDIRMPKMNGLELADYTRKHISQEIKIIILSGYYEFEFAKQAIHCDVNDYILKPIQKKELLQTLGNFAAEYRAMQTHKQSEGIREREVFAHHFAALACGRYDGTDLAYVQQRVVESTQYRYVSVEYDGSGERFSSLSVPQKVQERRHLYHCLCALFPEYPQHVIGAVNIGEDLFDVGLLYIPLFSELQDLCERRFFDALFERLQEQLKFPFHIYLGQKMSALSQLSRSYHSVSIARSLQDFVEDSRTVLDYDEVEYKKSNQYGIGKKQIDDLIYHVKINDPEQINACVDRIYTELKENLVEPQLIRTNIYYVLYSLADLAKDLDRESDQEEVLKYIVQKDFDRIAVRGSAAHFKRFAIEYAQYLSQMRQQMAPGVLIKIEKEIAEHYMDNLSLKSLGEQFYINSVYLGQVFKKHYGISFKEYLNAYRIDRAANLLIDTDSKVYEIAEAVGYNNPDYFISKFVQQKEKTPHQYRTCFREITT